MEADLYPLFGGYWGYQAAPAWKVKRHIKRWQAQKLAEGEKQTKIDEETEETRRKYEDMS